MDYKKLAAQAKNAFDKRGGTEGLKEDLGRLREIAKGGGTLPDKAKAVAQALKQPAATATETTEETDEARTTHAAETSGGSVPPVANAGAKRQAPGKQKGKGGGGRPAQSKQGRDRKDG
jgi:hypothetical protein